MASGDTKTEQMLDVLANGGDTSQYKGCCNTKTQNYILDAADRIQNVEDEVEELKNNPDVADIVATYADLMAYDKSKLTDKDIIRVLADETHDGDSTYYRYSKSSDDFTYIGESKQYTDFVGTDGQSAGTNGLVPAPATTDAGKFLKADGTWGTVSGGGPTVVQTTGTSTTDVMSQDATSKMIFPNPSNKNAIEILSSSNNSDSHINIGYSNSASSGGNIAIGALSQAGTSSSHTDVIAIGNGAQARAKSAIAIGNGAYTSTQGVFSIGGASTFNTGFNNSHYRLLTGVHDGQSAHDAATYGQLNTRLDGLTLVKISQTDYDQLQTKDPDTLYVITGA